MKNKTRRFPVGGYAISYLVALTFLFILILIPLRTQIIEQGDILNVTGVIVTVLGFAISIALIILAIDTFAIKKEMDDLKEIAENQISTVDDKIDEIDAVFQASFLSNRSVIAVIEEFIQNEQEGTDFSNSLKVLHLNVTQMNYVQRALLESNNNKKINFLREVIGSHAPGADERPLKISLRMLKKIEAKLEMKIASTESNIGDDSTLEICEELIKIGYSKMQ